MTTTASVSCSDVRFVKELYPRLKPLDEVVERYRHAIPNLPPIVVARDGVLVDGYHRWQAHIQEGIDTVSAENLGNLTDAEIIRESIRRNSTHGQQLSGQDKQRMAARLWSALSDLPVAERVKDIAELLAVSERSVQSWTKDARYEEKQAQQTKAWDLWLECKSERDVADAVGVDQSTVNAWLMEKRKAAEIHQPPASRQHFNIWSFNTTDGDTSYFGALPPQVMENLLWFFTEPGQIVADLFAGSGTTIDVAKRMGRRVWASDIRGNQFYPYLPIHTHDATQGWPAAAPKKADLVFLDPPYWKQAQGKYSDHRNEMAEMSLEKFMQVWTAVADAAMTHGQRVAYIISPTQNDDGSVIDHATQMLVSFMKSGWRIEHRIIVPYSTQQATGAQVTWARDNKRMLKLYRDLVVLKP